MDTQQFEHKRTFLDRVRLFFTMPILYVATIKSKDISKPDITLWSVDKNKGNVFLQASELSDKENAELESVAEQSIPIIIKMFIFSLFN